MINTFYKILLFLFVAISCNNLYSQTTVTHDIPWHSDTVGIWGSGTTAWSINRVDTLADFTVGPYSDGYSFVYHIFSDSVGVVFDYGAYADMQLIFEMSGWDGGAAKVNYPTKIKMDFPPDGSFSNGSWETITSEYREQDTSIYSTDNDKWDIYADWPNAGKIELYLNMNMQAHADIIYSDPSDPFNIVWDTMHVFEPINLDLDTFDIFLIDAVNNEYVLPWVAYHNDPITESTVIDSVYLMHDSIGWPLQFPPIFYDLIGISGDISIPIIDNYTKWIANEQRLYAWGSDEYMHINLDVIKFIDVVSQYLAHIPSMEGLTAVHQALQYEEGDTSIYIFTDPVNDEPFTADVTWDLIDAELMFTNTMNHTLSFEDNKEYSFFGIPIEPEHYPNVWNTFEMPIAVDYNILDTVGSIIETGTSDSITFCADYDIQLRLPCNDLDTLPITVSHSIDPWLTNMVRDSVDVDFYIKVLDLAYRLGTPSNAILEGSFLLYEDTLALGSFNGPPLFGPPLFMPWQIDGYFDDTTFIPDVLIIPENDPLKDSLYYSDILCFGESTGSVGVIASGGVLPYTYHWASETDTLISSNSEVLNIDTGYYFVTITDANACEVYDSILLSNINTKIEISKTSTDVFCYGDSTGSINLTVTGGVPSYQYNWLPNVGTTENLTNLVAGDYNVTVSDNLGCSTIDSITIINLNAEIFISTQEIGNVSCFNGNDGFIDIEVSGGVPSYTYHWSDGSNFQDASNLYAGDYTLTVVDSNSCTAIYDTSITETNEYYITANASPEGVCPGFSSNLSVSGAISYEWSPASSLSSSTGSSVLSSPEITTTYTVTGTDTDGCEATTDVTVTVFIPATISINGVDNICSGESTILTANGGVSYLWDNGATTNNINVSPINETTYFVTGTDTNTCINTAQHTVNVTEMPNANAGPDDEICELNYILNATPSVGNGSWSRIYGVSYNSSINDPHASITVNTTGNYAFIWTEDNGKGCIDIDTVNILLTKIPTSDFVISDIPCFGNNTDILYTGTGNSNCVFTWNWNNANVTTGIGIGPHSASWDSPGVKDISLKVSLNNCMSEETFKSVLNPNLLTSNTSHTNVLCNGDRNGTAEVIAYGGTSPYSYYWSTTSNNSSITGLLPGPYYVTVTDANHCAVTNIVTVIQPDKLVLSVSDDQNICLGNNATISMTATGGTPSYSYYWNNNLSSAEISVNINSSETYTASVIDANGCASNIETTNLSIFSDVYLELQQDTNEICLGDSVLITPIITEGLEPFIISDNLGNTLTNPINLAPKETGWYNITVVDACKSSNSNSFYITVKPLPTINTSIDITAGCSPLEVSFRDNIYESGQSYLWNFGDNNISIEQNPIHTYTESGIFDIQLEVTGANTCKNSISYSELISVWQKPKADFEYTPDHASFIEPLVSFQNTSIDGLFYSWNFGDGTTSSYYNPTHEYSKGGSYLVNLITITNMNCKDTISKKLEVENGFTFYTPTAFSPGNNSRNNSFYVLGKGISPDNFLLMIYDRWGEIIWQTSKFNQSEEHSEKWNGKNNNKFIEIGTYTWLVKFHDLDGVKYKRSGCITVVK